jgi:RND family efflux transporter MFP subunit
MVRAHPKRGATMRRTGVTAIALGLAATLSVSCGEDIEPEEVIRPVRYAKVLTTGGSRLRTFSGTVQAGMESRLSFKVGGTVKSLPAAVGDVVKKGQLLVELEDSDYRLRVQEAEASLLQAQAQERNAESSYERVQALYENRNASKQDLDAARAAFESARAQVETIGKRLELARLQVSYTRLKAPFAGSVAQVHVDENENVGSGSPVVTLTASGIPEVAVSVPGILISQVRTGTSAQVRCDAVPGVVFSATVAEVGVASTGFANTFPVTVRLDEAVDEVRPGMAAEVSFVFETAGTVERMIVPAVAVGEDRLGRFVYVIEPGEDGQVVARRRPVTVGDLTPEGLEIIEGLQEDELVVTAGVSRIADGQAVRLL